MPVTIGPFSDVPAPGDPVASAWAQEITQFAVDDITIGPSPPASANGELWYDTSDPGESFTNMPRGYVGFDATSSAVASVTSTLTYLGAQVVFTATLGRRYKTTMITGRIDQFTAAANAFAGIYDAGSQAIAYSYLPMVAGGFGFIYAWTLESNLSGSITRRVQGSTSAGSMNVQAGTRILVEDIGGF